MARPDETKIAPIEGGDASLIQALGDSDDAAVDDVEYSIGVGGDDIAGALQVGQLQGRKLRVQLRKVIDELFDATMPQIAPDQIADLGQDDIRNQNDVRIIRHKCLGILMPRVLEIEKRKEEAAVGDDVQESARCLNLSV